MQRNRLAQVAKHSITALPGAEEKSYRGYDSGYDSALSTLVCKVVEYPLEERKQEDI
jgi:hypothetical protein